VKACTRRERIIRSRECPLPQKTEKITKRAELTARYFVKENAADSRAINVITTISATRYEVGTNKHALRDMRLFRARALAECLLQADVVVLYCELPRSPQRND
jgi:hypothetical protein